MTRVAVLRDPAIPEGIGQFAVIQSVAPSLRLEVSPIDIREAGEIERAVAEFARSANGSLIVTSSGLANVHRPLILKLAVHHRLPAVYSNRVYVTDGGLISFGADSIDPHRQAAGYVNRILNGENRLTYRCRIRLSTSWRPTSNKIRTVRKYHFKEADGVPVPDAFFSQPFQLRPRLSGIPALLKLRLSLL
jgi:ABC-type uncharacterized transport system substrate-binding protein